MCLAHGSLFLVLILESILLGPLIRSSIFYGMKLALAQDLSANPENVILAFSVCVAITLIHFLVCLCIARALAVKRGGWLAPYFIWKPLTLMAAAALLACLFFEEKLHLITGRGELVHDEAINRLDKLIFLNHATGFVFNTYGASMTWVDFRNEVFIPPLAAGIAIGLWSLGVAVSAAVGYRDYSGQKVRTAASVDLEEEQLAYHRQYEMAQIPQSNHGPHIARRRS